MDLNQIWIMDATWQLSYVDEVQGHILKMQNGMDHFEKSKSDWNQTWFMDITWEPSYVHEVKGHIPRSKVI